MATVPKGKTSRARRDKRRSSVWKLKKPSFSICPQCGELTIPHRVCGSCGYYRNRLVVEQKAED
ncbi:MAG: 50S ribosomal protein L32 [Oscillospiraceae bacterium]|jgi:large subunit ribosomal protein L32|nr:50S ribosomal protein L32 [Oscillospiraceae bacterium]